MMDAEKLRKYALLLEEAIRDNLGKSKDVDFLAQHEPLLRAIADAKMDAIISPRNIGLAYWEMESNIRDFSEVSHRLAQFELLLDEWKLPSESVK